MLFNTGWKPVPHICAQNRARSSACRGFRQTPVGTQGLETGSVCEFFRKLSTASAAARDEMIAPAPTIPALPLAAVAAGLALFAADFAAAAGLGHPNSPFRLTLIASLHRHASRVSYRDVPPASSSREFSGVGNKALL
jgi:hypothetical protein